MEIFGEMGKHELWNNKGMLPRAQLPGTPLHDTRARARVCVFQIEADLTVSESRRKSANGSGSELW